MIPRYSLPEMAAVWSDRAKLEHWLRIEVLACEAWARLGRIPLADLVEIREGDALKTLSVDLPEAIDVLLLDGAKSLYPDILSLVESRLKPGALIIVAAEAFGQSAGNYVHGSFWFSLLPYLPALVSLALLAHWLRNRTVASVPASVAKAT